MSKTLGNPVLEAERSATKLLLGNYSSLALVVDSVANIPNLLDYPLFIEDMEYIIPEFFNKKGDVKIESVKGFAEGKDEDCFIRIQGILARAKQILGDALLLHEKKHLERVIKFEDSISNSQGMEEFTELIKASYGKDSMQETLKSMVLSLPTYISSLENILNSYGSGHIEYKSKELPSNEKELRLFLPIFTKLLFEMEMPISVGICIGRVVDAISSFLKSPELQPYSKDTLVNMIKCFKHPDSYYSMVKRGQITQAAIGQMFAYCFHEHALQFADSLLEDFPSMTYQQQLNFRKSFNIPDNDTDLIKLCSSYIQLGYTSEGSQI